MMPVRVVNVKGLVTPMQRREIVYVGRAWAGWVRHELANPFHLPAHARDNLEYRIRVVQQYREWLSARPTLESDLADLWKQTEQGAKSLGCWCCNWTAGDDSAPQCHAVVLGQMLHEQFAGAKETV